MAKTRKKQNRNKRGGMFDSYMSTRDRIGQIGDKLHATKKKIFNVYFCYF